MKIWSTMMIGSSLIKILRRSILRAFPRNGTRLSRLRIRTLSELNYSSNASTRAALQPSRRVVTCATISGSILVSGRLAALSATKLLHKVATWGDTSKTCMGSPGNSKELFVEIQVRKLRRIGASALTSSDLQEKAAHTRTLCQRKMEFWARAKATTLRGRWELMTSLKTWLSSNVSAQNIRTRKSEAHWYTCYQNLSEHGTLGTQGFMNIVRSI